MRRILPAILFTAILLPNAAQSADSKVRLELNAAETAEKTCRLTFVAENQSPDALDSMKLDLAVFNPQGIIQRRLVTEMGPLRAAKTMVRTFVLEGPCGQIGSILVNDVTACAPADSGACLDGLNLASRLKDVRFYK